MTGPATSTAQPAPAPVRVLVIDDEPDIRLMLSVGLRRHGVEVVGEGADGGDALRLCEETDPDAVVLDLLMPGMNGFEAIPHLRGRFPEVGVVAYTAVAGDFVRNEMRRLGIPLVLKQGSLEALADALRRASGRRPASAAPAVKVSRQ